MNITLEPGRYVVAVSGGVDSMALLDILKSQPHVELIVAHYDHGIRNNSAEDRKLVQAFCKQHNLRFVYDEGKLGYVSEATARKARYDFLHKVREMSKSRAIVTAHHQDDVLETAILNLLRGTGRRGLASLKSTDVIKRPLLDIPKQELIHHAQTQGLAWHEDQTNKDTKYLRNYIRHKLLPKFSPREKQMFLGLIKSLREKNAAIEQELNYHLHVQPGIDKLDRKWFIMLPHVVAREIMHAWLRRHAVRDVTTKTLERLVTASKTFAPGRQTDVDKRFILRVDKEFLALVPIDR